VLERVFTARLRHLLPHGESWTVDGLESAALWAPPGEWKTTPRQDMELSSALLHPRLVWRLPLVLAGLLRIQAQHPADPPHWYLAVLGTEPAAQGQGLASAALAPVLERCDRDGVAAYLESSKESNIAFYARHGFRVAAEHDLPRGGPRVWSMWREPR
jgi:ribosomal protein S18 acetylase RimI-like enzyme